MKFIKFVIIAVAALGLLSANAQTNTNTTLLGTNTVSLQKTAKTEVEPQAWELTLGASGIRVPTTGQNEFGFNVSLETNPFKKVRSLWVGFEQELGWEPTLAGSTSLFSDWSTHIYKNLYLNTGWAAGTLYGRDTSPLWRTGPQASLQYFVGDSAFIYAQANYDIMVAGPRTDNPIRISAGIGITF